MKKSNLPLEAVSYLQQLANGNPRMVPEVSSYFYELRDAFDKKNISESKYLESIRKYIEIPR
ncbi:MAG: hypothetical protein LBS76_00345 [Mycoplasmataceae bacterium]|jgi:alanine-alpha-ketoisovalerate/valine-pyruvate aminotransferase|nr:hypothetical protein [Mycoplasmataceae bacterium]